MIAIEHLARMWKVELILTGDAPRERGEPIKIVTRGAILRRAGFQHAEFIQLVVNTGLHALRHYQRFQPRSEGIDIVFTVVFRDTQLALDDLELLTQEKLALAILHLCVDLLADLALQQRYIDFFSQQRQDFLHPLFHR